MKNPLRLRILTVFIGFMALFTIILGKALKVQLIDRDALMARSKSQFLRETKIYPKRGNIYDRNGNPLAINVTTYSIFTIPKVLKGDRSSYRKLSKIVPELTYKKIKKKVHKRKRYTFLARKIPLTKAQVSKIKKLKGIYIESVPKRLYPNHELLSQIVGFVGLDNVGLAGLEYQFDKELKGEPKVIKYIKDAKGRAVKFESQSAGDTSKDIHLTIDKEIQAVAERYLKEAVIEHKAIKGGIGVMDVESGEILAMANYPTFEPNKWKKSKESLRKSSFLSNPIEPGSVFKILTVASALENKIARPDTNYYCEQGRFLVQGHTIKEADSSEAFEWLSMEDIIVHSSNIGTTKIAFDITYPNLKATLEAFNIGKKTGIEAPGESRGIFMNADNISPLSLSNISFGQGVATTGIQMLA
ncbi:MAG: penicillin-binding protein 2, partial [Halobacteriovoraceae bacterium]|nr:penicillin-binding protein 2 [Halobacteriovoraceae bacterium]